jgi:hypothetical protein
LLISPLAVLDPRISYAGLEKSFADDFMLLGELKSAKQDLYNEYGHHYAPKPSSSSAANSQLTSQTPPAFGASPKKQSFLSRLSSQQEYF